ncbi:MAG TPA: exo-alpha-sialidase [Methylomirabilota bacterium]|nr:exo-alpha-sialidase [Methylomirabilota bacterium]
MWAVLLLLFAVASPAWGAEAGDGAPFLKGELIFPPEHWHNHGSCIVEAPNGDLIVCWFHGSGERTADDVRIEGARKRKGSAAWSERFVMADTPDYPDTNCAMFIDPQGRLWLLWPAILANLWESALMKYRVSSEYLEEGPPRWERSEVLHVTPGPEFERHFTNAFARVLAGVDRERLTAAELEALDGYEQTLRTRAADKLSRRLGWMTRAHPFVLDGTRLIVPLYSDGFDCSLMAITDDWGGTWRTSGPLVGGGNIQPSIVKRRDGSLYTVMRDNGPPPKRLHQSESFDRGETWSEVTDSEVANPGSGAEIIALRNGNWLLIGNDTERGRHRLAVMISDDEGRSWKWKRYLENDEPGEEAGAYHYPSVIQAADGTLHATYSHHLNRRDVPLDEDGRPMRKSIKYVHFNEEWVKEEG